MVSITETIFFYLIPLLYLGKFERMAVYLFTYFFVSQGLIRATVTAHTCHNSGLFMVYHKYKWRWCARITSHFQKNSNRLCRIYVPFCISFLLHDSGRRTYPSPQKYSRSAELKKEINFKDEQKNHCSSSQVVCLASSCEVSSELPNGRL